MSTKSITEILGDAQMRLGISYDIQEVFEDYLIDMNRSFLAMLRLIEDFIPPINENRAVSGTTNYPRRILRGMSAAQTMAV